MYCEHEDQQPHPDTHYIEQLCTTEHALRCAALVWLSDVARRLSKLAEEIVDDIASGPIGRLLQHAEQAPLIASNDNLDTQNLPPPVAREQLEQQFIFHISEALSAINSMHVKANRMTIPIVKSQLETITDSFHSYLDDPDHSISSLMGQEVRTPPTTKH